MGHAELARQAKPRRLVPLAIRSGNLELTFVSDGAVVTEEVPLVNMDGVSAEDKLSCLRELLLIATDTYFHYVFRIGNIFVHVFCGKGKLWSSMWTIKRNWVV